MNDVIDANYYEAAKLFADLTEKHDERDIILILAMAMGMTQACGCEEDESFERGVVLGRAYGYRRAADTLKDVGVD